MELFSLSIAKVNTDKPIASQFPMHIHEEYEIYYFLSGNCAYSVEGNVYQLSPGDIVILNKNEAHHPIIQKSSSYTRMYITFTPLFETNNVLHEDFLSIFANKPIGLNNYFSSKLFPDNNWHFFFNSIYESKDNTQKQVFLMALLLELKACASAIRETNTNYSSDRIHQVTQYIDRHLTQSLSIEMLSQHFFVSPSQLNRNFKKNLGITVGEYISTKRLLLAHELICQGQKPKAVYKNCGFYDYSAFYRAYKKKFGHSPRG